MTYTEFINKIKESGIEINPYGGRTEDFFHFPEGNKYNSRMKPKFDFILQSWRTGGVSGGRNYVEEDVSNVGAEDVINTIINFWECEDGVYEIITCNVSTDWETGYMDGYDYKLIPFSLPKNKT